MFYKIFLIFKMVPNDGNSCLGNRYDIVIIARM
jgi:hypothetical protein